MKHILSLLLVSFCFCSALQAQSPWKVKLHCPEENILLHIDLYEESINVPGMDMFGPMNGYLGGNIYGVWSVTSFRIQDDKVAMLRLVTIWVARRRRLLSHSSPIAFTSCISMVSMW